MEYIVEVGEAVVSPEGILYLGRLYSLKLAIRLQWFAKAKAEGSWSIPIYHDANLLQFFIKMDGQYIVCTPIQHRESDQEHIHIEIGLFRKLKERWLENRLGNSKKYFPGKRSNR